MHAGESLLYFRYFRNAYGGLETPTSISAILYLDGVDDSATTPLTCTTPATGKVQIAGTLSAGYSSGQNINIELTATVDGVVTKQEVAAFTIEAADLTAAGVRSAVGLASANLDTQLAALTPGSPVNLQVEVEVAAS